MGSVKRLRVWFASLGIATVLVVIGFYMVAKVEQRKLLREIPPKLGIEIQQSSQGFVFSKSEGGKTLFTIRASRATQYNEGNKASLHDVNIVVYGRQSNRFDQIYGSDFEYDPQAGTVSAKGEVHIDLQGVAEGDVSPDQGPPREMKNPIHLKTEGLVFNQKSGTAHTDGVIEFRVPQASGQALGATYESKTNRLTLEKNVELTTGADKTPTQLKARHGEITKDPREIILEGADLLQQERTVRAQHVQIALTEQNDINNIVATGDVQLEENGPQGLNIQAPRADLLTGAQSALRSALFSGGVQFSGKGTNNIVGRSQRLKVDFADGNRVQRVEAFQDVHLLQTPQNDSRNQQNVELSTQAFAMNVADGKRLTNGETGGPGTITLTPIRPQTPGEKTVITANHFQAEFDDTGHIARLRGEPEARVVSLVPGQPEKSSESRTLVANFAPGGGLTDIIQEGSVFYVEPAAPGSRELGGRKAQAQRVRYLPDDDTLTLTGSPRFVDSGMTITADSIRVNRRSGDAFAQGSVKSTYSELRQQPNGALLATADPVHVTSSAVNANRQTGIARYTGGARLWQAANAVEAPVIEFDRVHRSITAEGSPNKPVTSVFVQIDNKQGKTTPMVVTAQKLTYVDAERQAHYTGGIRARGNDLNITAAKADVILLPAGQNNAKVQGPSQLDRIIAERSVVIQQQERRANGEKLVFTAADNAFVLTGGAPMLSDPEHGTVRGDSLTFYSHDDRVVVASEGSSRTVTRARVTH
ncbi:MAG TPA: LptA/OstA family protein [Candidatus Acidoferrales bacterium]|nr:LptA/OstA family protein [Candidatus Acidoferrales bacterium]